MAQLSMWEEVCGPFSGLREVKGKTIVTIGCVGDIEVSGIDIDAEIGETIAILRTDTDYRIRKV
jgi:hypothetical protein